MRFAELAPTAGPDGDGGGDVDPTSKVVNLLWSTLMPDSLYDFTVDRDSVRQAMSDVTTEIVPLPSLTFIREETGPPYLPSYAHAFISKLRKAGAYPAVDDLPEQGYRPFTVEMRGIGISAGLYAHYLSETSILAVGLEWEADSNLVRLEPSVAPKGSERELALQFGAKYRAPESL